MRGIVRAVCGAVVVAAGSAAMALAFNAVRPSGIPLVADRPYDIFVPCPEPLGEVDGMDAAAAAVLAGSGKALLIDAGSAADFRAWHPGGAWNIAFDYIMPVEDVDIRRIASSRAAKVVVYGDGGEPDTGRELARELAGRGIKNVVFVKGGVQAFKAAVEGR